MVIKRGEIYYADLSPVVGSEQGGLRPVLIIQNDTGNKFSPTVIVIAITSQLTKTKIPTHVELDASTYGLPKDSVVLSEQIRTIDKHRLKNYICMLDNITMKKIDNAIRPPLALSSTLLLVLFCCNPFIVFVREHPHLGHITASSITSFPHLEQNFDIIFSSY